MAIMTFKEWQTIPPGTVVRTVITRFHTVENNHVPMKFIVKKGHGYDDWAIYGHHSNVPDEAVLSNGTKVISEGNIKSLFPCDDEVYSRYRF